MKLLKKIFSIKTNKSDTNSGDHTAAINEVVDLDVQKVIESGIVDEVYYLANNPDVAGSSFTAHEHFAKYGWKESRNPALNVDVNELQFSLIENKCELRLDNLLEIYQSVKPTAEPQPIKNPNIEPSSNVVVTVDSQKWKGSDNYEQISDLFMSKYNEKGHSNDNFLKLLLEMFNPDSYLKSNEDVKNAGADPFRHYFEWGYFEGRLPCGVDDLEYFISNKLKESVYKQYSEANEYEFFESIKQQADIAVCFHSGGNFFFREIAEHLTGALIEAGHKAVCLDQSEILNSDHEYYILVAPHEVYALSEDNGLYEFFKNRMPKVAYYLTEQPQTTFFLKQLPYLFDDVRLLEMNLDGAKYLRSLGLTSYYIPLGDYNSLDYSAVKSFSAESNGMYLSTKIKEFNYSKRDLLERPIDVSFVGNCCPRRGDFFSRHGAYFSSIDSALFIPEWNMPHSDKSVATLNTNDSLALAQRSKIFLNVHRDEFNYFEWHRLVLRGMVSGAVVLTEPVKPVPGFVSGIHYIECELDQIPATIDWLLTTAEGNSKMLELQSQANSAIERVSCSEKVSQFMGYWMHNLENDVVKESIK